jgi:ABC-type transporter lipoprotein component MlaA/pimeloyl-ACP methyl ester carboxylesterase
LDEDPLEPLNRVFVGLNEAVAIWVADPLSAGWRFLVPQVARDALVRAADNIEFPRRGINHLLQGRTEKAGIESQRFLVNSTLGVFGLFDAATKRGLEQENTDTGTTFALWGWQPSPYMTLPLGMPGTARDFVGGLLDTVLDPAFYFFPALPIKGAIVGSEHLPSYTRFIATSADPYARMRLLWTVRRAIQDTPPLVIPEDGAETQSLANATMTLHDPWFPYAAQTRAVKINHTGRKLPYDIWMQEAPSPLVFILPGLSGHRQSIAVMTLAEMLFTNGYSVATISSAMNFEFMQNAATVPVPGFAPADARDVHAALTAVWRDLARTYNGRFTKRMLVGMSMGGTHAMEIAAIEDIEERVDFDAYVAINPPVQLRYAAEQLDAFFNTPLQFPEEERDERVLHALKKGLPLVAGGAPNDTPFSRDEARFLIGLSYRLALHDAIWVSEGRHDSGVLKTPREPLQQWAAGQEILDYSMMEYAFAFLLPYFASHDEQITTEEQLFARADLRTIGGRLRANQRAGVVCNANDFLLSPEDLSWLREVFSEGRLIVHPDGGHLGNLQKTGVEESIRAMLAHLGARVRN